MKKLWLAGLLVATSLSGNVQAETIFEALSETYRNNPTLQAQRAYLRSVDENVAIAKSGYRPNIALKAAYTDADVSGNSPKADMDNSQKSIGASITQPIFSGFSTYNTVRSADSVVKAEQNNLYTVEQSVFLDAATAYLDVLRDAAIVDLQKNNEKLLKKRLDETVQRFNVGEVTRTDVSQAKARHSQAQADRISSEGNYEASKAAYVRVIGSSPKDLSQPENMSGLIPATLGDALSYALAHNYSIRQAKNMLNSKIYTVAANNGGLLPQVNASASATKNRGEIDLYSGDTTIDNVEWGINMTLPLYNSGETRAKIRQSKYQKWQAQEVVLEAERQVKSGVTSAWEYMKANKAKIKSIQDQVKANEIALDGVQKEEALGNRTILDVLDAYQELLNSNVQEVTARRDYYVSGMNLLQAMGKLTAQDLALNVDIYHPEKYSEETRDKWLSLSVEK